MITTRYKTLETMKLAANLLPDSRLLLQHFKETGQIDLYNTTVHFDTGSSPGRQNVNGEGQLSFALTSWAPVEPGTYPKSVEIGLYEVKSWTAKGRILYYLTLDCRAPAGGDR